MIKKTIEGILAGILISLGGSVFLALATTSTIDPPRVGNGFDGKVAGAFFFTVALLCICYKGYSLFTGKVGYLPESHTKEDVSVLLWGLLGNVIGTLVCGVLVALALPALHDNAEIISAAKLTQAWWQTLIRAFFCGILMYLAVSIFRDKKTPAAILFCVPVFILAGFEHSVADMFYFAAGYSFDLKTLLFIVVVLVGNALGGMILPALRILGEKTVKKEEN